MATETTSAAPAASTATERTRTIAALWRDAVRAGTTRKRPPYLVERDGAWEEVSWAEAERMVEELAHGLLALGIKKGDAFGIVARTSLEWALFDFALALIGAIATPVYPNSSHKETAYVLEHAEVVGALVEDDEQRAKVEALGLRYLLTIAELDGLRERGREHAGQHPDAVQRTADAVDEDDLFTYIYTSGTTGPPKGCMIRHRNYYAMVDVVDDLAEFIRQDDLMLLYLPLAHNFGRLMHLSGPYAGFTIAFLTDPLRVAEALSAVRPTVLPSVPRVYEKVHARVLAQFDEATGLKRRIIDWAMDVGRRASALLERGEPLPRGLALQRRIADRLVYAKVLDRLGGRMRMGISGGAPLAREIAVFFHSIGFLILEGWGLTECTSAATANRPDRFRFGTVGLALPRAEVAVADDGELLIRSPTVFAGYLKDDEATRSVLVADGWLRSGDIGTIDADGFVTITDRKKDIIVTAGGKNVAPQNLENELKTAKEISQALVIGDRRPYIVALITVDPDATKGMSADAVQARVEEIVADVNRDRSRFEQIKKFAVLPRDFSLEEGEITPTLKLKRRMCEEHFAAEIDALYAP